MIRDDKDLIGVVTVHEGPSLPAGEIIASIVGDDPVHADTYHNKFQEPERFLAAGGMRDVSCRSWRKAPTASTACSPPWSCNPKP